MSAHEVIIVGGGPAGLAAAAELHRLGIRDTVVLEREQHAGGVPRHCRHRGFGWVEFRRILTGPAYAQRLLEHAAGAVVRTGTTVTAIGSGGAVQVAGPGGRETLRAARVLLATGARETPRAARLVSGTRPWGVFTTGTLQQMVYLAGLRPCRRAVVVGSELVAFSSLLTLRHAGARAVALLEESGTVLAPGPARLVARAVFGTRVITGARVVAIQGAPRVTGVEIEHPGGRETIACDGVVFSGRFVPETALLRPSHLEVDPGCGGPVVDQYARTTDPIYLAAGNLLRPVEASWTAWAEGRAAARVIAASLRGTLPEAHHHTRLEPAGSVRYISPQRIAHPAPLPAALPFNLIVDHPLRVRLRVMADSRELWGERRTLLPERRVLLPLPAGRMAAVAEAMVEVADPVAL
ncbi:MAG: NAD(P)/FAD-dependent oxidoreductase [Betaproteobacteria bacterium]